MNSNYLLGDVVYVNMPSFKGLAKVGGVDNRRDGIYYYLTAAKDESIRIVAHGSEVEGAIPIGTNKLAGPIYLAGRISNGQH